MKKFSYLLIALITICLPFLTSSCSCGLEKYNSQSIIDLYKITVENQIDPKDGKNSMFSTDYTICVDYAPIIQNIELSEEMSNNEYNLYSLEHVYNELFEAIFRYYENWSDNFYEYADEELSVEEFNSLHSKLNAINLSLIKLSSVRDEMQEVIASNIIEEIPSYAITGYIYTLNDVVQKSLDFMIYFRDLHITKIFTDSSVTVNTLTRTLDDMMLSYAQLVFIDNIRPFNIDNGETAMCDLSLLIKAYSENNAYVKFLDLENLSTQLRQDVIDSLNNNDVEVAKDAQKYMYYSNVLRQNILTLNNIADNINYYRLSLYRYGAIEGGVVVYNRTISDLENSCFEFLTQLEYFINYKYLNALSNLT